MFKKFFIASLIFLASVTGALAASTNAPTYLTINKNLSPNQINIDMGGTSAQLGTIVGGILKLPSIDGTPIGATTPSTGSFTSMNIGGNVHTIGTFALDTTYSTGGLDTPGSGAFFGSGGNAVSYVPLIQGVGVAVGNAPTNDHQRATALFTSQTTDDGHSQENTVGIETRIATGLAKSFVASTAYSANDNVSASNAIYRVASSCTAGTTAPTGFGDASQNQTNGSCTMQWVNAANLDAKLGLYSEAVTDSGGGQSWNMVLNTQLRAGATPTFNASFESDFGNNAANCVFGSSNCYNTYLRMGGNFESTHALYIDTNVTGGHYASHFGIRMAGTYLTQDADFETDSSGAIGVGVCSTGFGACFHPTAGYYDQSSSPIAIQLHTATNVTTTAAAASSNSSTLVVANNSSIANIVPGAVVAGTGIPAFTYVNSISGTSITLSNNVTVASGASLTFSSAHSVATIVDDTTGPTALSIAGNKSYSGIYEHSTTPIGIKLSGTYSQYEITGNGFTVDPSGNLTAATITSGTLSVTGIATITSVTMGSSAGTAGTTNKIALYGNAYGLGVSSSSLDYISGGAHSFYSGSTLVAQLNGTALTINDTTASSGSTTGALVISGGVGVGGVLSVAGNVVSAGSYSSSGSVAAYTANDRSSSGSAVFYRNGGINRLYDSTAGDVIQYTSAAITLIQPTNVSATTTSTSPTTGALIDAGGLGVSGASFFGGTLNVTGLTTMTAALTENATTVSTSVSTGAIIDKGGLGVTGASYLGGAVNITAAVASTSTTTGSLIVTGGVGISGAEFIGGAFNSAGLISSTPVSAASATGTAQTGATAITSNVTRFATVTSTNNATILNATLGAQQLIINNGTVALLVFPPSGASISYYSGSAVTAGAANASYSLPVGAAVNFSCVTTTLCTANP